MEIIPNLYLTLIQTIPFLVTVVGLYVILWQPLLAYLAERDASSATARAEAKRLTGDIELRLNELDTKLEGARIEIAATRATARATAQVEEAKIVSAARTVAEGKVSEAIVRIRDAQKAASASLDSMSKGLSNDIATQVLGREVSA